MTAELKPCPFCGKNDLRVNYFDIDGWSARIMCDRCDGEVSGPDSEYKYDDKDDAASDAAARWNTRPPAPTHISMGWRPISCLKLRMMAGKLRKVYPSDETAALLEEAAADIERLELAPAEHVMVKPLRWKGPDSSGEYHSLDGLWGYIVRPGNGNGVWLTEVENYFPTVADAQAAAWSDYEARIRAALASTEGTEG